MKKVTEVLVGVRVAYDDGSEEEISEFNSQAGRSVDLVSARNEVHVCENGDTSETVIVKFIQKARVQ